MVDTLFGSIAGGDFILYALIFVGIILVLIGVSAVAFEFGLDYCYRRKKLK